MTIDSEDSSQRTPETSRQAGRRRDCTSAEADLDGLKLIGFAVWRVATAEGAPSRSRRASSTSTATRPTSLCFGRSMTRRRRTRCVSSSSGRTPSTNNTSPKSLRRGQCLVPDVARCGVRQICFVGNAMRRSTIRPGAKLISVKAAAEEYRSTRRPPV